MGMSVQSLWVGVAAAVACVTLVPPASARAQHGGPAGLVERVEGPTPMPPGFMDGIDVVEHLGAKVPLDGLFRDQTGAEATLATVVRGDLPVLLTFNYSSCPGLCDVHLNALVDTLADAKLQPGRQFRLVSIILAPDEAPDRVARTRDKYVQRLRDAGGDIVGDGWTFLIARDGKDETAIRAVAGATGFGYRWVAQQAQYAHPATVVVLAPSGVVTRYLHGVTLVAEELDRSIIKAGLSEPSASAGFLVSCFHWNPKGRVSWGVSLMRYGGLGFASLLIVAVTMVLWRRSRHLPGVTPS